MHLLSVVAFSALASALPSSDSPPSTSAPLISVPGAASSNASAPIPPSYLSYSIEFAFFTDYAGNLSQPNEFTANLLENLRQLQGSNPILRVGGNTQDYALYNASLATAAFGIVNPARSPDYPTTLYIGPKWFESYQTLPGIQFTHGFNLALGANNSVGWETLLAETPVACNALRGKLYAWEYGNEPDLYTSLRLPTYNEEVYVAQWLNGTRAIKEQLQNHCPDMLADGQYGYYAPSFAGTQDHLKPLTTYSDGLDQDHDLKYFSMHNYINGANVPGVTLKGTLLNHTNTLVSISHHTAVQDALPASAPPYILGETNSLYNQGRAGLSNTFGAGLWNLDFAVACASRGIRRVHFHMGTDYRYAAWQPVNVPWMVIHPNITSKGTKPPYYGNVAAASFVQQGSRIQELSWEGQGEFESAYVAYNGAGAAQRALLINLNEWNYTSPAVQAQRPSKTYTLAVPGGSGSKVTVTLSRLSADGSDALSGITWAGYSYNYELDNGKPVRLHNVTDVEHVVVKNGMVSVEVPDSSAVMVEL